MPVHDISSEVLHAANRQIKIYRDQFDQWFLEDVAGNGLAMICGSPLQMERSFPWQGRIFSIGPIQFTLSVRPNLRKDLTTTIIYPSPPRQTSLRGTPRSEPSEIRNLSDGDLIA